jgi:hypothetical protein
MKGEARDVRRERRAAVECHSIVRYIVVGKVGEAEKKSGRFLAQAPTSKIKSEF